MNKIHQRRFYTILLFGIGLALATSLILYALKKNINVFLTPSELRASTLPIDYHFRLGGMVKKNSIVRDKKELGVQFIVTDFKQDIPVRYVGVLPDLFREEKGVIVEGHLTSQGFFMASEVLAKHDENYMPKKMYQSIREQSS